MPDPGAQRGGNRGGAERGNNQSGPRGKTSTARGVGLLGGKSKGGGIDKDIIAANKKRAVQDTINKAIRGFDATPEGQKQLDDMGIDLSDIAEVLGFDITRERPFGTIGTDVTEVTDVGVDPVGMALGFANPMLGLAYRGLKSVTGIKGPSVSVNLGPNAVDFDMARSIKDIASKGLTPSPEPRSPGGRDGIQSNQVATKAQLTPVAQPTSSKGLLSKNDMLSPTYGGLTPVERFS